MLKRVLSAALWLALVCPVFADDLKIVNDADWAPLSSAEQPRDGIINAIIRDAFAEAGHTAAIELLPWSRALAVSEAAKADALGGAFYTEERAQVYLYSDPFYSVDTILLARADHPLADYGSLEELKGQVVGVIQDNAYPGGLLEANLDFHPVMEVKLNIRKLYRDRVDLVADVRSRLRHAVDEEGLDWSAFKALKPPLGRTEVYLVVSRQHPEAQKLIDAFNAGLARFKENGGYDALLAEYGFGS